jgi:hypothetical protein
MNKGTGLDFVSALLGVMALAAAVITIIERLT